jgi:hypothetical protein
LRFGDAALALGLLSQAEIDSALGEQFGVGSKDLYNGSADKKLRFFTPFSKEAEEIRGLRSELLLKYGAQEKIKFALISPGAAEGKTYMAASLAIALSQVGRKTLLIDADLRTGNLHELFSLGVRDGLSSVLIGRLAMSDALIPLMPNLHILPAGHVRRIRWKFCGHQDCGNCWIHATTSLMLLYLIPARRLKVRTPRWLLIRLALLYWSRRKT